MIIFISVKKLHAHPNNPRKDLGDLTELAESIKTTGILQNLTVVPWFSEITGVGCDNPKDQEEMGYRVVIGHRRLAAAKLAGLTEVPCGVVEMDLTTQVATMLLENMQRSDLTIYEQAECMQMMFNLGETVGSVSEKTGLSDTTVRRRVKLLELDREKFKKAVQGGATLQDFAELDKIKDIELKNKALEKIGTSNFNWTIAETVKQESQAVNKAAIIVELEKFATKIESGNGLSYAVYINFDSPTVKIPEDAGDKKYFFVVQSTYIELRKESAQTPQTDTNAAEDERQCKMQERQRHLTEISKAAYRLRYEFVKNYTPLKKHAQAIMAFATRAIIKEGYYNFDAADFVELMGVELVEDEEFTFNTIAETVSQSPEKALFLGAYCNYGDSENKTYYQRYGPTPCHHLKNEDLNAIYDVLVKLGYQMSDEERSLQDGTHELFTIIEA
jgi:ParB family chromosome partitioning protein